MSNETAAVFEALFALEDVREILRETAPEHELTDEQKGRLDAALKKLDAAVKKLEKLK